MRSTPERHLHELDQGLYWQLEGEAFAMNKIVLEHYPVEKLEKELCAKFSGLATVRLTLEGGEPTTFTRQDLLALKGKLAGPSVNTIAERSVPRTEVARKDLLSLIGKPAGPSLNTFETIRAMRDDWD